MRQPVKGKPHIVPFTAPGSIGVCGLFDVCGLRSYNSSESIWINRWETRVEDAWTRWWRQHQEAA